MVIIFILGDVNKLSFFEVVFFNFGSVRLFGEFVFFIDIEVLLYV